MLLMPPALKKSEKTPRMRRCKYCRAMFIPERPQDFETAKFCCAGHRKNFWRYGGLPFDKMRDQIWRDIKRELPALVSAELLKLQQPGGARI